MVLGEDSHCNLLTDTPGFYDRNAHTGIFDRELVCSECERSFDTADKAGNRFFIGEHFRWSRWDRSDVTFLRIWDFDVRLLRLFLLTTLWRIGATTRREFAAVKFPEMMEPLRRQVLAQDPGSDSCFSVVMRRFDGSYVQDEHGAPLWFDQRRGFLNPNLSDLFGSSWARLYLGNFTCWIHLSDRPPPAEAEPLIVRDDRQMHVQCSPILKSKEFEAMQEIVVAAVKRRPSRLRPQ
jgi:hypothetical protein